MQTPTPYGSWVAAIGLASVVVTFSPAAISTHENMKQKNAATADAAGDHRNEYLQEETRERIAVDIGGLVDFFGTPDMKPRGSRPPEAH